MIANNSKPNHLWRSNATDVPSSSFFVNDRNDQVVKIIGYGDYQLGNVIISRVYYVEGLGHNLFSVRQFCDADLEVAFRKNICFIQNLEGVDLLSGSRDTNLYTISLDDMLKTSPICLLSKASKTRAGYGTVDYRISTSKKSKKSSHQPKAEDTNQEKLYLLHMNLYGPMRVESINGKKYILVRLNATVRNVITDNGTKFVNQTLRDLYENVSISHQTSVTCTPQQNGGEESPRTPHFHDDPLHESLHEDSTSQGSSSNVRLSYTSFEILGRWTKDHPIANVIGDPSRFVSIRKQLKTDAMWCYFDAFLTFV
ncbi:retrovirus-related pol polyprotein from transposon TNT 1-94 [Tanacetum coccineum]|uniref:Retrovirus-related pol polyprotein from transposon TNT 1-94 n=1 Tax=Tanacetum coccineum TaxID=301880 RepID=A0ABQ5F3A3_9ASTR